MSASIIDPIKERVEEARKRVERAKKALLQAQAESSAAETEMQAWEKALEVESMRQGIVSAPSAVPAGAPLPTQVQSNGSKTEMVRQYVRQHPGSGPGEIFKGLQGRVPKMY